MGQIAEAKTRQAQAKAEEEQIERKLAISQKELPTLEVKWKSVEKDAGDNKKKVQLAKRELAELRQRLSTFEWDNEKEQAAEMKLRELKQQVRHLSDVSIFLFCFVMYLLMLSSVVKLPDKTSEASTSTTPRLIPTLIEQKSKAALARSSRSTKRITTKLLLSRSLLVAVFTTLL